jgi:hypothetical protein
LRTQSVGEVGMHGCATDPNAAVCVSLRDENDHAEPQPNDFDHRCRRCGRFRGCYGRNVPCLTPSATNEGAALAFELYPAIGATSGIIAQGRF